MGRGWAGAWLGLGWPGWLGRLGGPWAGRLVGGGELGLGLAGAGRLRLWLGLQTCFFEVGGVLAGLGWCFESDGLGGSVGAGGGRRFATGTRFSQVGFCD